MNYYFQGSKYIISRERIYYFEGTKLLFWGNELLFQGNELFFWGNKMLFTIWYFEETK